MPPSARPLVLASASPRRRDLLAGAGVAFDVIPSGLEELTRPGEPPVEQALRLAREKAVDVATRLGASSPAVVLGADTLVVIDAEVLGKPRDPEHAVKLLSRLVGRRHFVITGVALVAGGGADLHTCAVESAVRMRAARPAEIRAYVATGEPLDKAGAYAAQGLGRRFIESIEGSESNVIGLPMDETLALLRAAGVAAGAP